MALPAADIPTIAEARRMLTARIISVPELVEACAARIDALDPQCHAFATPTLAMARETAVLRQKELDDAKPRGPLHGIPVGFKDIYDTKGILTTASSRLLEHNIPTEDATAVSRLEAAGAISLGKLQTWEFALGGPSFDLPRPPAANPWNLEHDAGGSSSGTGVAVATGMVLGGMGSDTGGSIRLPAAYCGIAGLKPTYGRISRAGVFPLSFSLDHAGPMAWTAEDCALMLQVLAGHDPRDPSSSRAKVPDYLAGLGDGVKGLKIAVPRHFFEKDSPADDDCIRAFDDALEALKDMGAEIHEMTLSPLFDYVACQSVISRSQSYTLHERNFRTRPHAYGKLARERITLGALYTAADYINAIQRQVELIAELTQAMAGMDLCMTPTLPSTAPSLAGQSAHLLFDRMFYTQPFNVTGWPALSICNGFSAAGLPFGLQIVGHPFCEAAVLAAGHAYETATSWRKRRPPMSRAEPQIATIG